MMGPAVVARTRVAGRSRDESGQHARDGENNMPVQLTPRSADDIQHSAHEYAELQAANFATSLNNIHDEVASG